MIILSFLGALVCTILGFVCIWLANRNEPAITASRRDLAEQYGFELTTADRTFMRHWRRGALFRENPDNIINIASGEYADAQTVICDIRNKFTIVAIRRRAASGVVIDIRRDKQTVPHDEEKCEVIAGSGNHVLYSNKPNVARKIADKQFTAFMRTFPKYIQVIWSEGCWSLASIPLNSTYDEIVKTMEVVQEFSHRMNALPPRRTLIKSKENQALAAY